VSIPSAPVSLAAPRVAALVGEFPRSPAFRGLADGLRTLIAEGRVPVGVRLPSERDLTDAVGVSRTTVTRAYDVLRDEGYLESRQGSGSVTRLPVSRAGRTDHLLMVRDRPGQDQIDLTIATPLAPPGTAAAFERAVERFPAYLSGTGYYPTGVPALREALARRYAARGLPTEPEQLIVVAGALAGVALAAQVLSRPGERVLVESPTYPNPITTLRARRARLVTTPVDPAHGWDVAHALRVARGTRMAYLIPDFHNPTGALMPAASGWSWPPGSTGSAWCRSWTSPWSICASTTGRSLPRSARSRPRHSAWAAPPRASGAVCAPGGSACPTTGWRR